MLGFVTKFFCPSCIPFGTGNHCEECSWSPVERWSMKNANRATPEGIIAAAVVQSLAKNFEDWEEETPSGTVKNFNINEDRICASRKEAESKCRYPRNWQKHPDMVCIINKKKSISFEHGWMRVARDGDDREPWFYVGGSRINDVELSKDCALMIANRYKQLKKAHDKAIAVAEKAKADMKKNEVAWDLVEKLLGLRRNEFGALEPVVKIEHS